MSTRTAASGIGAGVDPRERKLLGPKRRISGEEFIFGFALFEHRGNLVHANTGSGYTWFPVPDFRILEDLPVCAIKQRQLRPDQL